MHNLGQSQMEYGASYESEYGGMQEGGSPLQEILAGAGEYEAYSGEANTYQEFPAGEYEAYSGEAGGQGEAYSGETRFGEAYIGEANSGETYSGEAYTGETSFGEAYTGEANSGEMYSGEMYSGETGGQYEEEMIGLATELLSVNGEQQMEQFLGKLFRKVTRAAGGFLKSPLGRMLGGALRQLAKRALPMAGSAVGTFIGGPAGTLIGGQLAGMAGKALGLELGELSTQDADFAAARHFVRLASDIIRRAEEGRGQGPPAAVVGRAVTAAARQFAPALLGPGLPRIPVGPPRRGRRGTWVRRGRTITLYGV